MTAPQKIVLSAEDWEKHLRKPTDIPMQHPSGHIRYVAPELHDRLVRFGYLDCEIVKETVERAVPKATGEPKIPKAPEKKGG